MAQYNNLSVGKLAVWKPKHEGDNPHFKIELEGEDPVHLHTVKETGVDKPAFVEEEKSRVKDLVMFTSDSENEKAPVLTGKVTFNDGRERRLALWRCNSENPKAPALTGKISVTQEQLDQENEVF